MTEWDSRDLPVLQAIHALDDQEFVGEVAVAQQAAVSEEVARRSIRLLWDEGYVAGMEIPLSAHDHWGELKLTGDGLRAVGEWPRKGAFIDHLVAALEQAADDIDDSEETNRLRSIAGMLRNVATEVGVRVATNLATTGILGG